MHDAALRAWTLAAARAPPSLEEVLAQGDVVLSTAGPQYEGRFGLRLLQRRSPAARGFLRLSRGAQGLQLATRNVQRFRVGGEVLGAAELWVDGSPVALAGQEMELCSGLETCGWEVCREPLTAAHLGPIRASGRAVGGRCCLRRGLCQALVRGAAAAAHCLGRAARRLLGHGAPYRRGHGDALRPWRPKGVSRHHSQAG